MLSMTGYGSGAAERDGRDIRVELKSVNHRYLDISFRVPRHMSYIEDDIRRKLNEKLMRGHVDVYINYRNNREDTKQVTVDESLVKAYINACEIIRRETRLEYDMTLTYLAGMPNVLTIHEADEDKDELRSVVFEALDRAVESLCEMRAREGEIMRADIAGRLETLERLLEGIKERAPLVTREYREKLEARISEILKTSVDENRLAAEVAFFAERCSIDEEIARLSGHIQQMRESMENSNNGKKLDFIVQEMNRETNTIASKASDASLTYLAVEAKGEIEKIREQIQNIA